MQLPLTGSCVCGSIRFHLVREPLFTHACHCNDCQKITGSAFAMSTFVHADDLTTIAGDPFVVEQPTKTGTRSVFLCPHCQTVVWADATGSEHVKIVRPGVLANKQAIHPQAHIWVLRRQAWLDLDADVPQFERDYLRANVWPSASLARIENR